MPLKGECCNQSSCQELLLEICPARLHRRCRSLRGCHNPARLLQHQRHEAKKSDSQTKLLVEMVRVLMGVLRVLVGSALGI